MDNKLKTLLEAATRKTVDGNLKWQAFTDESFRAAIGSGYIHIHRGTTQVDDDGESHPAVTYSAQVTDEQGRVVAEVDVTQGFVSEFALVLADLFEVARKSALKTDRVIENMLGVLLGGS